MAGQAIAREAGAGVAMDAAGTDVDIETADVGLLADDRGELARAHRWSRRARHVVDRNLARAAVVIGVLVIGTAAGRFALPVAVLGHEIS